MSTTQTPLVYGMSGDGWPTAMNVDGRPAFRADMICSTYGEREQQIRRAIECCNACLDLPDPGVVPDLVAALKQALVVMESVAVTHGYDISIGVVPQARAVLARCESAP